MSNTSGLAETHSVLSCSSANERALLSGDDSPCRSCVKAACISDDKNDMLKGSNSWNSKQKGGEILGMSCALTLTRETRFVGPVQRNQGNQGVCNIERG